MTIRFHPSIFGTTSATLAEEQMVQRSTATEFSAKVHLVHCHSLGEGFFAEVAAADVANAENKTEPDRNLNACHK